MQVLSMLNHAKRVIKYRYELSKRIQNPEILVKQHFKSWSNPNHVNYRLFEILTHELAGRPAFIIETGTSAWGTDSTRFWNTYTTKFGGKVISIDIREKAGIQLKYQMNKNTQLITSDSVRYLKDHPSSNVDLYYFDSADVDWLAPDFSINHGLQELLAVEEYLSPGTIVVFDDTPINEEHVEDHLRDTVLNFYELHGYFPGKGSKAITYLQEKFEIQVLHHEYAFAARIIK